jgi:RNA polymerase sigma factor (sigma-70 family)
MKTRHGSRMEGLEELVRQWGGLPAKVCLRLTGARDEDLEQIGWVGIVEAYDNYDAGRVLPQTYFFIAAHHRMLAELRRRKREPQQDRLDKEVELPVQVRESVQNWRTETLRADLHREIEDAMQRLPFDSQRVLYLRFWLQMPWDEIAARMQRRPITVKVRCKDALLILRKRLSYLEE